MGQLYKIRLAFDQAHDDQAWLPASVSLQEIESGTQYECESGRWMVRSDKQDGIQEIACQSEGSTALPGTVYCLMLPIYTLLQKVTELNSKTKSMVKCRWF